MTDKLSREEMAERARALIAAIGSGPADETLGDGALELPPVSPFVPCVSCGQLVRRSGPSYCDSCRKSNQRARLLAPLLEAWQDVPDRMRWASFRRRQDLIKRVQASESLIDLVAATDRRNLLLLGASGAGKTALAVAKFASVLSAAKEAVADPDRVRREAYLRGRGAMFTTAYRIAREYEDHPPGRGRAPVVSRCLKATVLVVDELGMELGTFRRSKSAVTEILHERLGGSGITTVVTSYLSRPALVESYGAGVVRRLHDDVVVTLGQAATPLAVVSERGSG